ncbi:hypothetical protein H4R34_002544 [Dimargaris verticillata]|uniref:Uncharacterized protein n=1 Tax=Dimargaris verticillata TaxID=2761393 RepID=A0A9W8B2J9_9FUNG|nr:hypothetical protein H4R34_002544 [Dimargaris verticillata]
MYSLTTTAVLVLGLFGHLTAGFESTSHLGHRRSDASYTLGRRGDESCTPNETKGTGEAYGGSSGALFTYYWTAIPEDNTGGDEVELKDCEGKTLAKVSKNYAKVIQMEGAGLLPNGQWLGLNDHDKYEYGCYDEIDAPIGSTGKTLQLFTSVASNTLDKGTILYVEELDGVELPGGDTHNGCVSVDDDGWSKGDEAWLDWYVGSKANYQTLNKNIGKEKVTATISNESSCKILEYKSNLEFDSELPNLFADLLSEPTTTTEEQETE